MTLYMPIGLPGCGKSTWAEQKDGAKVFSSDAIREEYVSKGEYASIDDVPNDIVFGEMEKRTVKAISRGESVVYDATSISRKDRRHILDKTRKFGVERVGVLFLVPVSVCKERNANRERVVPDFVYDKMIRRFDVPMLGAEFDRIEIVRSGEMTEREKEMCSAEYRDGFDQHSPFHTLTIGEHMDRAADIMDELFKGEFPEYVREGVKLHDYGKAHTFFIGDDNKGHFYGHEHVGAYWYLVVNAESNDFWERHYKVAVLINWHMRPYVWERSEKAKIRDLKYIDGYGAELYGQVMAISKADRLAH